LSSRISARGIAAVVASLLVFSSLTATAPAFAAESAATSASETVTFAGLVTATSSDDHGAQSSPTLFQVTGEGYLGVDFTDIALPASGAVSLTLVVPEGVEPTFDALQAYSIEKALLTPTAVTTLTSKRLGSMINQTPITSGAHKVYAVLVTPEGSEIEPVPTGPAGDQTAEKVAAAVTAADGYWKDQSAGAVRFTLEGTTAWYDSPYSCATDTGSTSLWIEAANHAEEELGYEDAYNTHLVLFFPGTFQSKCDGAIGLATLGYTVNTGGLAWSIGTEDPINKATLTHELGHNLTFGHANWLDCAAAAPQLTVDINDADCAQNHYGDVYDVMGFGLDDSTGGSVSSPNAIRSGIWPSSAYSNAAQGTTTHTLKAVSSNSGKRAVVVEGKDGVDYFVEFRNFTGRDAQMKDFGCFGDACIPAAPGVRILRLDQYLYEGGYSLKGDYGDDVWLVGRTVDGVKRVNYTKGESYTSPASSGITVKVTNVTSSAATVSITRPKNGVTDDGFYIDPSYDADGNRDTMQVGDIWTGYLLQGWEADSYSFQWYNDSGKIKGATKQSYTLAKSDIGKNIGLLVVARAKGAPSITSYDFGAEGYGYGPVTAGVMNQGEVRINASAAGLTAKTTGWTTPGVSYSYQWFRNNVKIAKATKSTYTLVAADRNTATTVAVSVSRSGFNTLAATSDAHDFTVTASNPLTVNGTPRVGATLLANYPAYTSLNSGTPSIKTQWYANGKAIKNATNEEYTLVSGDYNKTISVTVVGGFLGFNNVTSKVTVTGKVAKGIIQGAPVAQLDPAGAGVKAVVGGLTEPGTKLSYQWYRGAAKISKATKQTYLYTSADANKMITVKITVSKSNYTTLSLTSDGIDPTINATGLPTISNTAPWVGAELQVTPPAYRLGLNPDELDLVESGAVVSYQWYANGTAIKNATASTYVVASADLKKKLTARVVVRLDGRLTSVLMSAATTPVVAPID
jgi:hypothetical protein